MPPSASRPTEVRITASYAFERWALLLSTVVLALSVFVLTPNAFAILVLAELSILALFLNRRYHSFSEVRKKSELASGLRKTQKEVRRLQAELARLARDERELEQSEQVEVATALQRLQTQFESSELSRCYLPLATIRGIGQQLKNRLVGAGIYSASDITYWGVQRVYGIGQKRAAGLTAWRQQCESAIRRRVPRHLPSSEESQIRSRYPALRTALQAQELDKRKRLADNSLKLTRLQRESGAYLLVTSSMYLRGVLFPSSGRPAASQVQPAPTQASAQQPGVGVAPAWYRRRLVKAVALGVASLALVFCYVVFSRFGAASDRTESTGPRIAPTQTGIALLDPTLEDTPQAGNTAAPSATRPTTRPSPSPATASATPALSPTSRATGTASLSPPTTATATLYTVQEGDTLAKLAKKFGVTLDDLVAVNEIEDPDRIEVGTVLVIPRPTSNALTRTETETSTRIATAGVSAKTATSTPTLVADGTGPAD